MAQASRRGMEPGMEQYITEESKKRPTIFRAMYGKKGDFDNIVPNARVKGYQLYKPSKDKIHKINSWFGPTSVFGAKTRDGAISFLDEHRFQIDKDKNPSIIILELDTQKHDQIDTETLLNSLNKNPKLDYKPMYKHNRKMTQNNDEFQKTASRRGGLFSFFRRSNPDTDADAKLEFEKKRLKNYHLVSSHNKEIVIDAGKEGIRIINVTPLTKGEGVLNYRDPTNLKRSEGVSKSQALWQAHITDAATELEQRIKEKEQKK